MKPGIITASTLSIGYRQGRQGLRYVQESLDFTLEAGSLTCLLGPNGAGKSTLLRTLGGTQKPLAGEALLEGKPIDRYSEKELSRQIGLVLTDKTYAGGLRVQELVALGRQPYSGFFGRLDAEDDAIVEAALAQTGIAHKSESYIAELSDGERQKVMIAKALAQECPVILLDEPTAFLDVVSRIEIMNLLHGLARQGKTILLSTHDIEQALLLADQLWLLSQENGLMCGTTEDLILRGDMDRLFKRGNIAFDSMSGSFRMDNDLQSVVSVKAEGELFFWTKNALMRNGFRVEEMGSTSGNSGICLEVTSATSIEVFNGDEPSKLYGSFGELISGMEDMKDRLK